MNINGTICRCGICRGWGVWRESTGNVSAQFGRYRSSLLYKNICFTDDGFSREDDDDDIGHYDAGQYGQVGQYSGQEEQGQVGQHDGQPGHVGEYSGQAGQVGQLSEQAGHVGEYSGQAGQVRQFSEPGEHILSAVHSLHQGQETGGDQGQDNMKESQDKLEDINI